MNIYPKFSCVCSKGISLLLLLFFTYSAALSQVDVALELSSDAEILVIGESVTFTIIANNVRETAVINLVVNIDFPSSLDLQNYVAPPGTSFDIATKNWTIGNQLTAMTESLTFSITLSPNTQGTHFLIAEVVNIDAIEYNSTAQNGNFLEDDLVVGCVAVPILINLGMDSVRLVAPALLGGHQWIRSSGSGTQVVSNDSIFIVKESGSYSYINTDFLCEASACCPILICAAIDADLGEDIPICQGAQTSIMINSSGGTAPYSYSWNEGLSSQPSQVLSPNTTTTYSVTVIDVDGCSSMDEVMILVEDCPDCALNVVPQQPVYDDNETPTDVSDDTFYITVQVFGNGLYGWTDNQENGNYGETVTYGPFSVGGNGVKLDFQDSLDKTCQVSFAASINPCIYQEECTCCKY